MDIKPAEVLTLLKTAWEIIDTTKCANKYISLRASNLKNFRIISDKKEITIDEFMKLPYGPIRDIFSNLNNIYEFKAWQYIFGLLSDGDDIDDRGIIRYYGIVDATKAMSIIKTATAATTKTTPNQSRYAPIKTGTIAVNKKSEDIDSKSINLT
jgi:hypothetical protein